VVAVNHIFDRSTTSSRTSESTYGFPLYTYSDNYESRQPNFHPKIIEKFANGLKMKFVPEKINEINTFAPIDVFDYIYAVLHSAKYCEKYSEFLKIDFPKVPYPTNQIDFWKLVKLGSRLRRIHLLESEELDEIKVNYPVSGDNIVHKVIYSNNKVYINDLQYFNNVPDIAWNFYIGGYQPAQKWLKDRRGRQLDYDDIEHYQKIINALYLTDKIMKEIDSQ
jgi:predicted helicase